MIINKEHIGKRFYGCSFDNFDVLSPSHKRAVDACRRLVSGETGGVVLLGGPGKGKTHLLVAIINALNKDYDVLVNERDGTVEIISSGNRIEFWPHKELAGALRASLAGGFTHSIISSAKRSDLFVLDDFGSENASEFLSSAVEDIIDYRYKNELPLAVSSNLDIMAIKDLYGPRIVSRWAETCEIVEISGGEDYRLRKFSGGKDG
jgi:DNA replication protein DnaC